MGLADAAIYRIAQQGMADMGHMDPYLMRSAGFQAAFDERRLVQRLLHLIMRHRMLALAIAKNRHFLAVMRGAPHPAANRAAERRGEAAHNGEIAPIDAVGGKLYGEALMRPVGLGNDQQAGSILVDPVDDAGPRDAADPGKLPPAVMEQGVDQRSVGVSRRRMDHKAGRLVDDDQMFVFISDGQRNVLRHGFRFHGRGDGDVVAFPFAYLVGRHGNGRKPLPDDFTFQNQRLEAFPRHIRDEGRQRAVEPHAVAILGDDGIDAGSPRIHDYHIEMAVCISRTLLDLILADAAAGEGVERCGLLLGEGGRIADVRFAPNIAPDPSRHFELDPAVLLAAHKAARSGGPHIMGHYHSHPSGEAVPSMTDAASAVPDGSLWLIVAGGEAGLWRAVGTGPVHGRFRAEAMVICGDVELA